MISETRTIQIGSHPVDFWYTDPPVDGIAYSADLAAHNGVPVEHRFYLTFLNGVKCSDLPNQLSLHVTLVNNQFRRVNFVRVRKHEDCRCYLRIVLFIDYQSWEMAESVASFAHRFAESLECISIEATLSKDYAGHYIGCNFMGEDIDDIHKWYLKCEQTLEKAFQRELVRPPNTGLDEKKYGEDRIHWWIRYVVVPIVGSGTIAAVLAKYVLL